MSGRFNQPRREKLSRVADRVVAQVLRRLRSDLRAASESCSVLMSWSDEADDDELLGCFEGLSLLDGEPQGANEMPRIRLFLDSIWEFSDRNVRTFEQEVAVTFLHELGHYLGLTEEEVEARGLG